MKTLKKVVIWIGVLIAILLILAFFIENEYSVEKEISITKPKTEVFGYLKYLKNQDNFSKWATMDTVMTKTFRGTDGTVGFVSAWESDDKNVGSGEQEIIKIIEGERIDYELRFLKPFPSTSYAYLLTDSLTENQTRVTWGFNGKMTYPMNVMLLIMDIKKMIGEDLEYGLTNLKTVLEK